MHRTLKMEATRPAGSNFLQQQAKFDVFVQEFNNERPHEALEMKCPADIYKPGSGFPLEPLLVHRNCGKSRRQIFVAAVAPGVSLARNIAQPLLVEWMLT